MGSYQDIAKSIKNKIYHPIYLLHGEEPYFVDQLTTLFENMILDEGQKEFNLHVLYGKEIDALTLMDVVRRYPMMSEYQVVILKEAQNLKDTELLLPYIENPLTSTIFVMAYKGKKIDKRTKFAKSIVAKGEVFESKKLYDNQVPGWIAGYMKERGVQISEHACTVLRDYLGNDLAKISNELEKLMLNLKGTTVDVTHIEKNIGISKDYNIFEFTAALGKRDVGKAGRIMDHFVSSPKANPFVMLLGGLYRYFSRLYLCYLHPHANDRELASLTGIPPFAIRDHREAMRHYRKEDIEAIIGYLHEYDLRSKGVNNAATPEGELLRELTWKMLHVGEQELA